MLDLFRRTYAIAMWTAIVMVSSSTSFIIHSNTKRKTLSNHLFMYQYSARTLSLLLKLYSTMSSLVSNLAHLFSNVFFDSSTILCIKDSSATNRMSEKTATQLKHCKVLINLYFVVYFTLCGNYSLRFVGMQNRSSQRSPLS